ncbi:MAG TPA: hypothetical protein VK760_16210 [Candidatus Acidoferrales bacterium]|jgi:hypothetical protein|nr:hypothetical protein [Candidatus Acidoferrales bacterium]
MEKERGKSESSQEREDDVREAVTSADATGLIAGEELITQAETLLPLADRSSGSQDERRHHGDEKHGK